MSYIENNLIKGERIAVPAKVHWWAWGKGLAIMLVAMLLPTSIDPLVLAILYTLGPIFVIRGAIVVMTTELAVTNKRVIAKFGLIKRDTIELLHGKVEGITVQQSVLGRLLGFGTITVNGTGSGKTPIPHIAAPLKFRRAALEEIEQP